ncbi:YoaK family protein [Lacticaseibacillus mingshuiensis]|uniref:YoaK family protein n=1 Tax=Lacticaseibacillus mingshuiensis TaxID=2799574 RepID=A0ABW4CM85_9LACO|nr:YoaK family protein [Lacticaseibacillus mingshuiensis]
MRKQPDYTRLLVAMGLAAVAGSLDGYTYLTQGQVFAGLQTGNLILLGIHLGAGQWQAAWHYVTPLVMFGLGTLIARLIQHRYPKTARWTRSSVMLAYELGLILLAGALATLTHLPWVTGLLSMVAGTQLQEFRELRGKPFTPLMMTGNLRTFVEALYDLWIRKDHLAKLRVINMGGVLLGFLAGVALAGALQPLLQQATIFLTAGLVVLVLVAGHLPRMRQPRQADRVH